MRHRTPLLLAGLFLVGAGAIGTFMVVSAEGPAAAPAVAVPSEASLADPIGVDRPGVPIPLDWAEPIPMTVYLTPTCGCCSAWVEHMGQYGFEVALEYRVDLTGVKQGYGVRPELSSCHTAVVNGYVFEGHVPGEEVRRFLAEAPPVRGLAVPGMPIGSPGMEMGGHVDPYEVLTFTTTGRTEVYSRYGSGE